MSASLDAYLGSARGLGSRASALAHGLVLLASLERRFAAVDVDGRQHFKPYARTCFARTAHARRP